MSELPQPEHYDQEVDPTTPKVVGEQAGNPGKTAKVFGREVLMLSSPINETKAVSPIEIYNSDIGKRDYEYMGKF